MTGPPRSSPPTDTFDALYEGYRAKVYRVILRLVQDPSDAEDLTQETFLKVQRSLPHVKRPDSVPSWLYRIATNTALDFLRHSARRGAGGFVQIPMETAEAVPSHTPSPTMAVDSTESAKAVRDNIHQLPVQYRIVLVLHEFEGLPLEQVAEVTGSSLGATRVRLHRARKRFAEICEADCDHFFNEDGVLSCQLKSTTPALRPGLPVATPTHSTAAARKIRSQTDPSKLTQPHEG